VREGELAYIVVSPQAKTYLLSLINNTAWCNAE